MAGQKKIAASNKWADSAGNTPKQKAQVSFPKHEFLLKPYGSITIDTVIGKLELRSGITQSEALSICRRALEEGFDRSFSTRYRKRKAGDVPRLAKQVLKLFDEVDEALVKLQVLTLAFPSGVDQLGLSRSACDAFLRQGKILMAHRSNVEAAAQRDGGRPQDYSGRIFIEALARAWIQITGRIPEATRDATRRDDEPSFPSLVEAFCKDADLRRDLSRMVKTVISQQRHELAALADQIAANPDKNPFSSEQPFLSKTTE